MKESRFEACNYECKLESKKDDIQVNDNPTKLLEKNKLQKKKIQELRSLLHKQELQW